MSQELFHKVTDHTTYVTVILPLAVPKPYTYSVPEEWIDLVQTGIRVEVQFGKSRLYAGLVMVVHQNTPQEYTPKPIISILDEQPIINETQFQLWKWISEYYCCTMGEVMNAALPAGLKLSSETRVVLSPLFDDDFTDLNDKQYLVAEALSIQNELSIEDIQKILNQKTVYPLIKTLLERKVIYLKEELQVKYKPKSVKCVRLREPYLSNPSELENAFKKLTRSTRQMEALLAYIQLSKQQEIVKKQDVYNAAQVGSAVIKAIADKEIFEIYDKEVSRIAGYEEELINSSELSTQQETAIQEIKTAFEEKNVALLHGVTGSGKTRVYVELIKEAVARGEQVLYLLPEIALTTQIVERIQKIFGDQIAVYHSRFNNNERVEMWQAVLQGKPILLGARSGMFLPFSNLKLIIVDEEHDSSFKQVEPAPRYNARDAAIYLAHIHKAKVILGTATPSIESYFNTRTGKYALVEMNERFGGLELPEVVLVDAKDEFKKRKLQSHFTSVLLDELKAALERGEQAILFQNRRGYAPMLRCGTCAWTSGCIHCDVSLTYHKFSDNLRCHYCGYQSKITTDCPACGDKNLSLKGFGTEKIEDELKVYLPNAKIGRMDFDTVKGKNAHAKIINNFEEKRIDILVGTQMVTKGLDFDNVGIVGVLSADHLLQFPDFRASERAFQVITQVSGRAGRKKKGGKVIIQAFNVGHPVIKEVMNNDYASFFDREVNERQEFIYPPYYRLIKITLKHKKPQILNEGTKVLAKVLKDKLGTRMIGPAVPGIPRVRGFYLLDILIKLERNAKLITATKELIREGIYEMQKTKGFSNVRVNVDVDPY